MSALNNNELRYNTVRLIGGTAAALHPGPSANTSLEQHFVSTGMANPAPPYSCNFTDGTKLQFFCFVFQWKM
jgi:hypothetical protein